MPYTLKWLAEQVQKEVAPHGAFVTVDRQTDNLLVERNSIGFVITRRYIDSHPPEVTAQHAAQVVAEMAAGKIECKLDEWESPVKFRSIDELRRQGDGEARFDPIE